MKLYLCFQNLINYISIFILVISIIFCSLTAIGVQNENKLIEKKLKDITSKLRCMTCQNQSIHDSEADFSLQIKKIIKDQIIQGKSEKDIINFLVSRYGEYIVFKPMMNKKNIFLWVFPFVLFIFSLIIIGMKIKSKN